MRLQTETHSELLVSTSPPPDLNDAVRQSLMRVFRQHSPARAPLCARTKRQGKRAATVGGSRRQPKENENFLFRKKRNNYEN